LSVLLGDAELAARRQAWTAPAPKVTRGVLAKYVRLVKSASEGCATD
jgi:dihydroxy-acid dehydratase